MKNDNGFKCISPIKQSVEKLGGKVIEIPARIINNCKNLTALVLLKDADGKILDETTVNFNIVKEVKSNQANNSILISIILGILIVGEAIVYFIIIKKKENEKTK
jgi:hypothetical protein